MKGRLKLLCLAECTCVRSHLLSQQAGGGDPVSPDLVALLRLQVHNGFYQ